MKRGAGGGPPTTPPGALQDLDPAEARQRFYSLAGTAIQNGTISHQAVNDLVKAANGRRSRCPSRDDGWAGALAVLQRREAQRSIPSASEGQRSAIAELDLGDLQP